MDRGGAGRTDGRRGGLTAASPPAARPLDELERALDYCFLDRNWLERALTHATAGEGAKTDDNRQLAFLGDAVIELAVRAAVYEEAPMKARGDLSEDADKFVPDKQLANCARKLRLQDWLRVGHGEAKNLAGEDRRLADGLEAVAAAIYLDAGAHAFPVVRRMLGLDEKAGR